MPGAPELVVLALILLPLIVLAIIGFELVRRLLDLPDPSRVNELEREVVALQEQVDRLEEHVDADAKIDARAGADDGADDDVGAADDDLDR